MRDCRLRLQGDDSEAIYATVVDATAAFRPPFLRVFLPAAGAAAAAGAGAAAAAGVRSVVGSLLFFFFGVSAAATEAATVGFGAPKALAAFSALTASWVRVRVRVRVRARVLRLDSVLGSG